MKFPDISGGLILVIYAAVIGFVLSIIATIFAVYWLINFCIHHVRFA